MRMFKGKTEIRITKEDLIEMLGYTLNEKIFNLMIHQYRTIESVSLHPDNKYVARITIGEPEKIVPKNREDGS